MTARSVRFAVVSAVACALAALISCSEDGVTPSCPPLPLYQSFPLGDASPPDAGSPDSEKTKAEIDAGVHAGCITPATNGVLASSLGGASGSGGVGGGAAGHTVGGSGGSTSSENAGDAGRN